MFSTSLRINMKHDLAYLAPIDTLCVGIEHAQVHDNVLLVVCCEAWTSRRLIADIWIETRRV